MDFSIDSFPKIVAGQGKRKLFFDSIESGIAKDLRLRGYEPIVLRTLPRETEDDRRTYVKAALQGIEDGTIYRTKEGVAALRLDMQNLGMLDKHDTSTVYNLHAHASIRELWDWGDSRHTLHSGTSVDPREIAASIEKGKKKK
jgi:hypothetical protein